jgi:hypothetical protein
VDGNERRSGPAKELAIRDAVDIALGVGAAGTAMAASAARPFLTAAVGTLRLGARMSHGRSSAGLAARLAHRGGLCREGLERATAQVIRRILPLALESALAAIDVTNLIRAHVDLDALAKGLDVDAVVARVDLDAAVARVDLDRAVSRVHLDAAVARVDLDRAVSRVNVDAIIDRVDIEAALDRVDLAGIARQVIETIDLPAILRESSGVVSSQAVRVVRTEGMNADESVSRFFDRVLRRPHPGGAATP